MGKNILVVEDDEGILEVVQIVLEGEGYGVRTSRDGECLQDLGKDMPDLIILDVLLAGQDGQVLCKRLKSDEQTKHIPVIMLSARSDTSKLADLSGADDFIEKPFDVDALIRMVGRLLASSHTPNQPPENKTGQ